MQCRAFTRNFSDPPFRSVATFVFTRRHHLLKRSARRNAKSSSLSPSSSSTEESFNLSIFLTLHESRRQKAKCQFGFDTALLSEHTRPTWCFSSFAALLTWETLGKPKPRMSCELCLVQSSCAKTPHRVKRQIQKHASENDLAPPCKRTDGFLFNQITATVFWEQKRVQLSKHSSAMSNPTLEFW